MPDILIVCTGNICRSPMAEGFLRRTLAERFGPSAPSVASAGTWGSAGNPALPEAVAAAAERGADIRSHEASPLDPGALQQAELVLGMTQEHREAAAAMVPAVGARAFTLKELVRLLEGLPEPLRGEQVTKVLTSRVAAADSLRSSGFEGNPLDEDIVDPLGTPMETFRAVAWEIDSLCERLVEGIFGANVPAEVRGQS